MAPIHEPVRSTVDQGRPGRVARRALSRRLPADVRPLSLLVVLILRAPAAAALPTAAAAFLRDAGSRVNNNVNK
ncbi:hypothetical protein NITMOv2_4103 [Nitrospira moscoviensis]|uniref:Uncharacterized protein n=1 Tax=Nitrospira moscoviensis TaxID=42253 RepID=A0A0K2GHR2_NITMO|nr:hypothetical protein NITMOv2_4103 [Nitrospira moscoviensis]